MTAQAAPPDTVPNSLILQFNGKKVDGDLTAETKNAAFRPFFEKELTKLTETIPGKPKIKIAHWYESVLNGCAISWEGGNQDTLDKTKAALEKLPYIKSVEHDGVVRPN